MFVLWLNGNGMQYLPRIQVPEMRCVHQNTNVYAIDKQPTFSSAAFNIDHNLIIEHH